MNRLLLLTAIMMLACTPPCVAYATDHDIFGEPPPQPVAYATTADMGFPISAAPGAWEAQDTAGLCPGGICPVPAVVANLVSLAVPGVPAYTTGGDWYFGRSLNALAARRPVAGFLSRVRARRAARVAARGGGCM